MTASLRPSDPDGATRALQRAGVHAVVLPARQPGTCPAGELGVRDERHFSSLLMAFESFEHREQHPETGSRTVVIRPERIPEGTVLVLGTFMGRGPAGEQLFVLPELFRAPGPTCLEMTIGR
jgi:hypothetical protein